MNWVMLKFQNVNMVSHFIGWPSFIMTNLTLRNPIIFFQKHLKAVNFQEIVLLHLKYMGFSFGFLSESLRTDEASKHINNASKLIEKTSLELPTLTSEFFYNSGVVKNYLGDFLGAKKILNCLLIWQLRSQRLIFKVKFSFHWQTIANLGQFKEAISQIGKLDELLKIIDKSYLKSRNVFILV